MHKVKKEIPIDVKLSWDGGIGEIEADAFKANMPETLTEEHFEAVDNYRDQFVASVAEQVLEQAPDYFANNEGDLSVVEYGLGGNATLGMTLNNDYHLTSSISVATGEALNAVQDKAKEMYKATLTVDA